MLYRPIWWSLQIIFRVFFRKIFVSGSENIITDKPVIYAGNHVNAFLDPLILPIQFWKKIYFISRGDIYNTKFKRWLLWQTGQLPMFRQRDGKDNLKRNEETNERCYDLLKKKRGIIIFPEGDCIQEKHIRMLKKGAIRMAFGAVEKHGWDIDVHIQPITNNYTFPSQFRTEIILRCGKPLRLMDYKELYESDEAKAITQLTKDTYEAMRDNYVQLDNLEDQKLFEQLVEIERNSNPEPITPWIVTGHQRFDMEKGITDKINAIRGKDDKRLEELTSMTNSYFKELKKLKLKDSLFKSKRPKLIITLLLALLLLPVFVTGYALNIIQFTVGDWVARKKIRLIHFKNSIRMGIILALNLVLILIASIVISSYSGMWAIAFILYMPFSAWVTVNYKEQISSLLEDNRFKKIAKKSSKAVLKLKVEREKIRKFL
ncbi:MAG: hypothetical protein CL840_17165 [Crocinitomicaceae bacterium]|nr:hypothetical protein [Crocinitomicaceae bacterium]|tara:strand:+ start:3629 stop:4921 length:1293 start_codon:yes stop_codon:yes gene_type:complete